MRTMTLFFTHGVSLKNWAEAGFLGREHSYYRELQASGIKLQFLTYGDESDREFSDVLDGIDIIPVYATMRRSKHSFVNILKSLAVPFVFRRSLCNADVFKTNQIWGSWVAVIAKFVCRRPLFVRAGYELYKNSLIEPTGRLKLLFIFFISKMAYRCADFIWVTTPEISSFVQREFSISNQRILVFPNWIDTELFRFFDTGPVFENRILYIGRLSAEKNIPLLIRAAGELKLSVDIVGEGPQKDDLVACGRTFNAEIRFLGRLSNSDLPDLINRYPIFVLCSNYEGSPKALLEAMACESAVIGTNKPGIRNVIIHNDNGLICDSEVESLKTAISTLHADTALRRALGNEARRSIVSGHSRARALSHEIAIIDKIAKSEMS